MTKKLSDQTKNAFDFVQKLYFEMSYLIKEVEGQLQQENEKFLILRPSGYGITTRYSTGLEPMNVEQWLLKRFSVLFCPESRSGTKAGQTITKIDNELKLLLLHINIIDNELKEPRVIVGCIKNIKSKKSEWKKFEKFMWSFAYNGKKIFNTIPKVNYEDSYCSFQGNMKQISLFSIKNSNDINNKLVKPMVDLYRK